MNRPIAVSLIVLFSVAAGSSRGQSTTTPIDRHLTGTTAIEIAMTTNDSEIKWQAIRILGALQFRPAIPLLVESLSDPNNNVRANAAYALGLIRAKEATKPLIEMLTLEKDAGVIEQTSSALGNLQAKEAIPALKVHANHHNAQTRSWVISAIGGLGGRPDVPFVAKFLDDPNSNVQEKAARAIEDITGTDFGFRSTVLVGPGGSGNRRAATDKVKQWWQANKDQPASFWQEPPGK